MKTLHFADAAAVADEAVRRLEDVLGENASPFVGFPTGKTPRLFLERLAARHAAGLPTRGIRPFALDEYQGVSPRHPASFSAYLHRHVITPLDIAPASALLFDGTAQDADAECARYARALEERGPADLIVFGLGKNGHVAFNEPGSSLVSRTRVVALAPTSIAAVRADFSDATLFPTHAFTVGIADLLRARALVMLVTGAAKAAILRATLTSPSGTEIPATLLRSHSNFTVLTDIDDRALRR